MNTADAVLEIESPENIVSSSVSLLEQTIRERAYQLYLQRGGENGTSEEDWLKAEAELALEELKQ